MCIRDSLLTEIPFSLSVTALSKLNSAAFKVAVWDPILPTKKLLAVTVPFVIWCKTMLSMKLSGWTSSFSWPLITKWLLNPVNESVSSANFKLATFSWLVEIPWFEVIHLLTEIPFSLSVTALSKLNSPAFKVAVWDPILPTKKLLAVTVPFVISVYYTHLTLPTNREV